MAEYQIKIFPSIESIPKEKWNSLNPSNFPFQKYEFHHALEKSQSIGDTRGQWPFYITVWHEEDLVGALASYLKNHSYGEYIFDWEIANFFQMNQIQYYPKLVSYTPYTPAVGPKIMCSSSDVEKLLIDSLSELAKKTKCPSYSFLFLDDNDRNILKKGNYPLREYSQFFWHNHGLKDFEDFLLSLDSRKAKQIRRERRGVSEQGLKIQSLQGDMITDEHAEIFYKLYINTMNKKGSFDYLTKEFFH
ncbi:MAG: peptidogalycan biosysnthesis protein, partial [Bacteriovoracaceae bacterium]